MKVICLHLAPYSFLFFLIYGDKFPVVQIVPMWLLFWQMTWGGRMWGVMTLMNRTPMETPNIDGLARLESCSTGIFSSSHMCPTRIAIMTIKHPAVTQKTHVVGGNPPTPYNKTAHPLMDPWYSGRMKLSEVTIAEALKSNGYKTGHSGKWHMAIDHNAFPQPEDQGFDFPDMILVKAGNENHID